MRNICYCCGEEFEGVPQRRYCSTRCRKRIAKKRERRKALEIRLHAYRIALDAAQRTGSGPRQYEYRRLIDRTKLQLEQLPA